MTSTTAIRADDETGPVPSETRLRAIALTVEEHVPGEFAWCLRETMDNGATRLLGESLAPFPSYSQALRAGVDVLLGLAHQAPHGPRVQRPPQLQRVA